MKQIYDFEQRTPPVLNEQMLRAELERRKLRIQTAVAVLAGFLLMIAAVLLGYSALRQPAVVSSPSSILVKEGKQHEYRCDCPCHDCAGPHHSSAVYRRLFRLS